MNDFGLDVKGRQVGQHVIRGFVGSDDETVLVESPIARELVTRLARLATVPVDDCRLANCVAPLWRAVAGDLYSMRRRCLTFPVSTPVALASCSIRSTR